MGFEQQDANGHMDVFTRINALTWACKMDLPECLGKSHDRLTAYMRPPYVKVPPNLHNVVYCTGLKHGGKTEWDFLWKKYLDSHLSSEAIILLNALGCSKDPDILRRLVVKNTQLQIRLFHFHISTHSYLEKTVEPDSKIRDQDKFRAMYSVIRQGSDGVTIALEFMRNKLPKMIEQ